mmetsp:Transcript_23350/g.65351  ORF Transcript_23350/g.65351 Transcript_23350/m.65351 type:complete len:229 (+) Transcript_23350:722-1408(+)
MSSARRSARSRVSLLMPWSLWRMWAASRSDCRFSSAWVTSPSVSCLSQPPHSPNMFSIPLSTRRARSWTSRMMLVVKRLALATAAMRRTARPMTLCLVATCSNTSSMYASAAARSCSSTPMFSPRSTRATRSFESFCISSLGMAAVLTSISSRSFFSQSPRRRLAMLVVVRTTLRRRFVCLILSSSFFVSVSSRALARECRKLWSPLHSSPSRSPSSRCNCLISKSIW